MISLYRPGTSALHRMPAGAKLLTMAVLMLAITIAVRTPLALTVAAVAVIGCYALGGFGPLELWRQLISMRWVIVVMAIPQLIFLNPTEALVNTGRVVLVMFLAGLITLTTSMTAMLTALEHATAPLKFVGISPTRVSLLLSLTITTIPVISAFACQLREAERARGARPSTIRMIVPLLVLSLKHADDLGEALMARGADDAPA